MYLEIRIRNPFVYKNHKWFTFTFTYPVALRRRGADESLIIVLHISRSVAALMASHICIHLVLSIRVCCRTIPVSYDLSFLCHLKYIEGIFLT